MVRGVADAMLAAGVCLLMLSGCARGEGLSKMRGKDPSVAVESQERGDEAGETPQTFESDRDERIESGDFRGMALDDGFDTEAIVPQDEVTSKQEDDSGFVMDDGSTYEELWCDNVKLTYTRGAIDGHPAVHVLHVEGGFDDAEDAVVDIEAESSDDGGVSQVVTLSLKSLTEDDAYVTFDELRTSGEVSVTFDVVWGEYDDSETDRDASSVSANESTKYFEPVPELVN